MPYKDKEKKKECHKKTRVNRYEWFKEMKRKLQCIQCGENHEACLDFHHRDPKEKDRAISRSFNSLGRIKVMEEISKCDVLCANCHRKLHFEQNKSEKS